MKTITSPNNSYIKSLLKLQEKSRERRNKAMFIVEGKREISLVQSSDYEIDTILFVDDFFSVGEIKNDFVSDNKVLITKDVYDKIAYRESTEGIIAVVKSKSLSLDKVSFSNNKPLILVLEGIEKPGNIGAILRTADAANVDAVLIADSKTDMYNPNIIRSSVGCVFTNQIAIGSSEEVISFLKTNNIKIFSATLQNSNVYSLESYTSASAIVVGTEATGLTQIWRDEATRNINIPMNGEIDSMNVSVAAAIITFEAVRQRS